MNRILALGSLLGLSVVAYSQNADPPRVNPGDAKNHVGEMATVCGRVVDTKTLKYGIAGRGKPVLFDIDDPEPNPVFYFVAFGSAPAGPEEAITAYNGKRVCVTGKIAETSSLPFIMAADRTQIKIKRENSGH
jgi:hypothetical protein